MTFGLFRRIITSSASVYTWSLGWFSRRQCHCLFNQLLCVEMTLTGENWSRDQCHMNLGWMCVCAAHSSVSSESSSAFFLPVCALYCTVHAAFYSSAPFMYVSDARRPRAHSCTDVPQRQRESEGHMDEVTWARHVLLLEAW